MKKILLKGAGILQFPDDMTLDDIKAAIKSKFPDLATPKPDTGKQALKAIEAYISNQPKERVTKDTVIVKEPVVIEKEVIITEQAPAQVIEKQVIIEKSIKPKGWTFDIERDEDNYISTITAVPNG